MPAGSSSNPLPSTHPLVAELTSLRQQLAQYQKSGHQSAIQLQGARLELNFAKEESAVLRETNDTLRSEIDVLRYAKGRRAELINRTHPLPPTQPPTSTALAELTLAHRRLSTKLDLTEQALSSAQLELASCTQEIGRLNREREGDRAIINELRRGDEEREEEIAWERGERRKAEALKRLW
jgi:chromosome segregation ATPase